MVRPTALGGRKLLITQGPFFTYAVTVFNVVNDLLKRNTCSCLPRISYNWIT